MYEPTDTHRPAADVQNGPNLSYSIPGIKPIPSPRFKRDDWSSTETEK